MSPPQYLRVFCELSPIPACVLRALPNTCVCSVSPPRCVRVFHTAVHGLRLPQHAGPGDADAHLGGELPRPVAAGVRRPAQQVCDGAGPARRQAAPRRARQPLLLTAEETRLPVAQGRRGDGLRSAEIIGVGVAAVCVVAVIVAIVRQRLSSSAVPCHPSASVGIRCPPSLAVRRRPSSSVFCHPLPSAVVVRRRPSSSVVVRRHPSSAIPYHPSSSVVVRRRPSLAIRRHPSSSIVVRPLPSVVVHRRRPSSIVVCRPSSPSQMSQPSFSQMR